jgi:transcription-repair coupling factor (superfamily II helicase)
VRELRGQAAPVRVETHVELGIDAFIPMSYAVSPRQRMEVYRRLARCTSRPELEQLEADLTDACGPVPAEVRTLLDLAEIRILASTLGIDSIIRMDPDLVFTVRDFSRAQAVFDGAAGTVRLPDDKTAHWRLPPAYRQMPTLVTVLLKRLRDAAGGPLPDGRGSSR